MNAKEYLSRLIRLNDKIKKMEDLADYYRHKMCSVSGGSICVIGNDPSPSYESNNIKYLCYLDEQERKIKKVKEEYTKVEKEIMEVISHLDNVDQVKVLEKCYVELLNWEDIIEELYLSRTMVFKIHTQALKIIDEQIKLHEKVDC